MPAREAPKNPNATLYRAAAAIGSEATEAFERITGPIVEAIARKDLSQAQALAGQALNGGSAVPFAIEGDRPDPVVGVVLSGGELGQIITKLGPHNAKRTSAEKKALPDVITGLEQTPGAAPMLTAACLIPLWLTATLDSMVHARSAADLAFVADHFAENLPVATDALAALQRLPQVVRAATAVTIGESAAQWGNDARAFFDDQMEPITASIRAGDLPKAKTLARQALQTEQLASIREAVTPLARDAIALAREAPHTRERSQATLVGQRAAEVGRVTATLTGALISLADSQDGQEAALSQRLVQQAYSQLQRSSTRLEQTVGRVVGIPLQMNAQTEIDI